MKRRLPIGNIVRALVIHSPKAQRDTVVMSRPDGAACQGENHDKEDGNAARGLVLLRGDEGDQRADDQSGDQAADVRRVVDARKRESKDQIVDYKCAEAAKCA